MPFVKAGKIAKGLYLNFKNTPHLIMKADFHSQSRGAAFSKVKMKNIKTGANIEFTFKSNEQVEYLDINSREMQFLYMSGGEAVFMDPHNFEQVEIDLKLLDDKKGFLNSETRVHVLFDEETALGVIFPPKVKLKVTEAEDTTAGNRVNAPKKPVTLETGLIIQAPLFIKPGETLVVDTENGEYVSRAN